MSFAFPGEAVYTRKAFFDCVMETAPISMLPSQTAGKYHVVQEGEGEGAVIGGNLCTLNLLQGTPYFPDIRDKILFLEDDNIMGPYFPYEFERNFGSLMQVTGAEQVRGIVFGRFEESCGMDLETVTDIVRGKMPEGIPVVFGADFGHVFPMAAFPICGRARVAAGESGVTIQILEH